jgi:hypothetical protein
MPISHSMLGAADAEDSKDAKIHYPQDANAAENDDTKQTWHQNDQIILNIQEI